MADFEKINRSIDAGQDVVQASFESTVDTQDDGIGLKTFVKSVDDFQARIEKLIISDDKKLAIFGDLDVFFKTEVITHLPLENVQQMEEIGLALEQKLAELENEAFPKQKKNEAKEVALRAPGFGLDFLEETVVGIKDSFEDAQALEAAKAELLHNSVEGKTIEQNRATVEACQRQLERLGVQIKVQSEKIAILNKILSSENLAEAVRHNSSVATNTTDIISQGIHIMNMARDKSARINESIQTTEIETKKILDLMYVSAFFEAKQSGDSERVDRILIAAFDRLGADVPPQLKDVVEAAITRAADAAARSDASDNAVFDALYYSGNYAAALKLFAQKNKENATLGEGLLKYSASEISEAFNESTTTRGKEAAEASRGIEKNSPAGKKLADGYLRLLFPQDTKANRYGLRLGRVLTLAKKLPDGTIAVSCFDSSGQLRRLKEDVSFNVSPADVIKSEKDGKFIQENVDKVMAKMPSFKALSKAANTVKSKFEPMQKLFVAGKEGHMPGVYVENVKNLALILKSDNGMDDLKANLAAAKEDLAILRQIPAGQRGKFEQQLEQMEAAYSKAIKIIENDTVNDFCSKILSAEFTEDTLAEWMATKGAVMLSTIVGAVLATALTFGAGGIVVASAAGALGGIVGSEVGHVVAEKVSGHEYRSRLGTTLTGGKVWNHTTGTFEKLTSVDLATMYGGDFAQNFVSTLTIVGLGKMANSALLKFAEANLQNPGVKGTLARISELVFNLKPVEIDLLKKTGKLEKIFHHMIAPVGEEVGEEGISIALAQLNNDYADMVSLFFAMRGGRGTLKHVPYGDSAVDTSVELNKVNAGEDESVDDIFAASFDRARPVALIELFAESIASGLSKDKGLFLEHEKVLSEIKDFDNLPDDLPQPLVELIQRHKESLRDFMKGAGAIDTTARQKNIATYNTEFRSVVSDLKARMSGGNGKNLPEFLGSGSNGSAFRIEVGGKQYAVKIDKGRSSVNSNVGALIAAQGVKNASQLVAYSVEDCATVMELVHGTELSTYGVDNAPTYTDEHILQLIQTVIALDAKGVTIDPKVSNFIFDPKTGFTILDYHLRKKPSKRGLANEIMDLKVALTARQGDKIDYSDTKEALSAKALREQKSSLPTLVQFIRVFKEHFPEHFEAWRQKEIAAGREPSVTPMLFEHADKPELSPYVHELQELVSSAPVAKAPEPVSVAPYSNPRTDSRARRAAKKEARANDPEYAARVRANYDILNTPQGRPVLEKSLREAGILKDGESLANDDFKELVLVHEIGGTGAINLPAKRRHVENYADTKNMTPGERAQWRRIYEHALEEGFCGSETTALGPLVSVRQEVRESEEAKGRAGGFISGLLDRFGIKQSPERKAAELLKDMEGRGDPDIMQWLREGTSERGRPMTPELRLEVTQMYKDHLDDVDAIRSVDPSYAVNEYSHEMGRYFTIREKCEATKRYRAELELRKPSSNPSPKARVEAAKATATEAKNTIEVVTQGYLEKNTSVLVSNMATVEITYRSDSGMIIRLGKASVQNGKMILETSNGKKIQLTAGAEPIFVGRILDPTLPDTVSSQHCRLFFNGSEIAIKDVSTNGTHVKISETLSESALKERNSKSDPYLSQGLLPERPARIDRIMGAESQKVMRNLEIHGDAYQGQMLTPALIQSVGLGPKEKLTLGKKNFFVSEAFNIPEPEGGNRIARLLYCYDSDVNTYVVRTIYRSNSQGNWRLLPQYSTEHGEISHYSKGYDESSVNLPIALLEQVTKLTENPINTERFGVDPFIIFAGTAREKSPDGRRIVTYHQEVNNVPEYVDGNFEVPRDLRNKKQLTPPEQVRFGNPYDEPNFSRAEKSFTVSSELYGGSVTMEVFLSYNGKYRFTMCRDKYNRAWLGPVERTGDILTQSTGLNAFWVNLHDLQTPAFEYNFQSYGWGNNRWNNKGYVDMFANYLSKIPLIQRYYTDRGIQMPRY